MELTDGHEAQDLCGVVCVTGISAAHHDASSTPICELSILATRSGVIVVAWSVRECAAGLSIVRFHDVPLCERM